MEELVELRGQNSKTFDLGNGKRLLEISIGAIHYKDDYTDAKELFKEIDLAWDGKHLDTAPYELTLEGQKVTFRDKRSGEVSTLERTDISPNLEFEVVPFPEGVHFRHTVPSDKVPFEAQFRVDNPQNLRCQAHDDEGPIVLETSLEYGILTERLSEVRDVETGELRQAKGSIRVDPTLTVQPGDKDTEIRQAYPDTNLGSETFFEIKDTSSYGYIQRGLLEFDISDIPSGSSIDSAKLELYYYTYANNDPVGKTIWAYKLTRTDWVESEVTWNEYKSGSSWTNAGGDYVTSSPSGGSDDVPSSTGQWMEWAIQAIVQDAHDGSNPVELLLRFDDESTVDHQPRFYTKEYTDDTSLRPKLTVEYTALPTASTEPASDITSSAARLNGKIDDDGGESCEARFRHRKLDYALDFDGDNDYVDCGNDASLSLGTEDITLAAWINITAIDTSDAYVGVITKQADASWDRPKYGLELGGTSDSGKVRVRIANGDNHIEIFGNSALTVGNWYHVVAVIDRDDSVKLYIDSIVQDDVGGTISGDISTSNPLLIGKDDLDRYLNGLLDDVRVYSRALSSSEVSDLYNGNAVSDTDLEGHWKFDEGSGSTAYDETANDNDGTIEGATWVTSGLIDWTETSWQNSLETDDTYYEDITGLDAETEYEFQTQAKNTAGEGDWSASATFTTEIAETAYNTMVGDPTSWVWAVCEYEQAEECPVGAETGWAWQAPTLGGSDKTPQGSPTSFAWGSE